MGKKLFVGGLAWGTDENGLRAAFAPFGDLVEVKVVRDRVTNRSRGFGFVTFADQASAERARAESDGRTVEGRALRVDWAQERARDAGSRRGAAEDRPGDQE